MNDLPAVEESVAVIPSEPTESAVHEIRIVIPGESPRPPFASRSWLRTPHAIYISAIAKAAEEAMCGGKPWTGPVELRLNLEYLPPVKWSKARRASARWKITAPAAQNLVRLVLDGLTDVVFHDDEQVAVLHVSKVYGATAKMTITVRPLTEGPGLERRRGAQVQRNIDARSTSHRTSDSDDSAFSVSHK
jgi:Holliday junction resolvase RusA-like endonuclease